MKSLHPDRTAAAFEQHRTYLERLAYRMTGSVSEAQDIVQDAYLRWHGVDQGEIQSSRAFLSKLVSRLCLDHLKSARRQRESYVGPWLPEPVPAPEEERPDNLLELTSELNFALMLTLERLSPLERAAFLMHDIFDVSYQEVAETLGRSEPACRQLAARARSRLRDARPRFPPTREEGSAITNAFFEASRGGNIDVLAKLLAEDAVLISDGGGIKAAALNPIYGAVKVARFIVGVARKFQKDAPRWSQPVEFDGLPGILTEEADGTVQAVALEIDAGRIVTVYVVRNPEKLRHLARTSG